MRVEVVIKRLAFKDIPVRVREPLRRALTAAIGEQLAAAFDRADTRSSLIATRHLRHVTTPAVHFTPGSNAETRLANVIARHLCSRLTAAGQDRTRVTPAVPRAGYTHPPERN